MAKTGETESKVQLDDVKEEDSWAENSEVNRVKIDTTVHDEVAYE